MSINIKKRSLFFIFSLILLLVLCNFVSATIKYKDIEPFEIKGKSIEEKLYLKGPERLRFSYDGDRVIIGILELKEEEVSFWIKFYSDGLYYTFTLGNYDKKSFDQEDDHLADFSLAVTNITFTPLRKQVNLTFVSYGSLEEVKIGPDDIEEYNSEGLVQENELVDDYSADGDVEEIPVDEPDMQPENFQSSNGSREELFHDDSIYDDNQDLDGAEEDDMPKYEYIEPKKVMSSSEFNRKMIFILTLVVIMVVASLVVLYKKKHHFI